MTKNPLISSKEIVGVELKLNPHNDHGELYRYHKFACKTAPEALRLRDITAFEGNPDHVMIRVWLVGAEKPITVGSAVLFDVDALTVELGSLFVSPLMRGMGFGQFLVDAICTKFNDDNNLAKNRKVRIIAKVRYGNYGPIPILNKSGFRVEAITDHKVHWAYDPASSHQTACRLYDKVIATGAIIEDDLFHSLCGVHGNVRIR